ncbi:hypothetical protein TcCL_NonESM08300 [Trypanosoma cruzi]|nr:hypothetical protein TcCL_NonESM08300 [Trypanosoma cruzi]
MKLKMVHEASPPVMPHKIKDRYHAVYSDSRLVNSLRLRLCAPTQPPHAEPAASSKRSKRRKKKSEQPEDKKEQNGGRARRKPHTPGPDTDDVTQTMGRRRVSGKEDGRGFSWGDFQKTQKAHQS